MGAAPSSAPSSRWRLLSSLPSPFEFLKAQTSPPPIDPPSAPHLPCHSPSPPSSNFSRSSSSPSMSSQVHPPHLQSFILFYFPTCEMCHWRNVVLEQKHSIVCGRCNLYFSHNLLNASCTDTNIRGEVSDTKTCQKQ